MANEIVRNRKGQFVRGHSGNLAGRPKGHAEVGELARQWTPLAISTLKQIAGDETAPHAARVSASVALLDRGWGRPHQSVDVGINRSFDEMSDAELMAIAGGADDDAPADVETVN